MEKPTSRGRGICGVGRVAIGQEGDMPDLFSNRGDTGIIETDRQCTIELSRGPEIPPTTEPNKVEFPHITCVNQHVDQTTLIRLVIIPTGF
jgi:hypothetical protein